LSPSKVSLTLCLYCSRFIVNHLAGIFHDGLIDAVDLLLVPYGNAHVHGANNTINCQVMPPIHSAPSSPIPR
jgi:interferon gamma-inducible protein 30